MGQEWLDDAGDTIEKHNGCNGSGECRERAMQPPWSDVGLIPGESPPRLAERALDLLEQALLFVRQRAVVERLRQLAEETLLLVGEIGGRHHAHADDLVATTAAAQMRHAFPFQLEDAARLRAGWNP